MLNQRKLIIIISAAVVAVALIGGVIVYAALNRQPNAATATSSPGLPTVSGNAGDMPAPSGQFESWDIFNKQFSETARGAAVTACSWSKLRSEQILRHGYENEGMSTALAAEYTPVWAEVFAADTVGSAEIWCRVSGQPGINKVTGEQGSYVWRVAVPVVYQGKWVHNATPSAQGVASATWWLTIEQETGKVVAIEQPSPNDVQIRIKEEE